MLKHNLRQIFLPEEQLADGLGTFLESDVPGLDFALLKPLPEDFEVRLGIRFQESFDNLDKLMVAVLELPDGTRVTLARHRGLPVGGTEVLVTAADHDRIQTFDLIVREMAVKADEIIWRRF